MRRMNSSMRRLSMPVPRACMRACPVHVQQADAGLRGQEFDGEQLVQCIKELVKIDKRWIPHEHGYSLYIRPTAISTTVRRLRSMRCVCVAHALTEHRGAQPYIGVGPCEHAKLFVILSPGAPSRAMRR
jgi:hypothetical protein